MNGVARPEDKCSLSSPSYDPLIHLNEIFPDPASLASLSAVQLQLTTHLHHLDAEIQVATVNQRAQQSETKKKINALQLELDELFQNVEHVRLKAENADGVMGGLTGGIRRLDGGKKSLTTSMTALKRLQMLSMAFSQGDD
jgi:vacuolar protein sorting-associated protein 53